MTDGGVAQLDDEIAGVRAALRWGVLLARRANPYHEPAGSPIGGQFAKAPGGGVEGGKRWPIITDAIRKAEKEIQSRETEKAFAFSADGDPIFEKEGKGNFTSFTRDELKSMTNGILVHNHPGGQSFSPSDIELANDCNLAEVRVVTKGHVYSMRPRQGAAGWGVTSKQIRSMSRRIENQDVRAIAAGKISCADAGRSHWDRVWASIAADMDWRYSKEAW
jgi:hypothetical protein